jgi:putative transposase
MSWKDTSPMDDNGVPFATTGIHGLSRLNVWWIKLGIQHQRILPAHPQ